jgi:hypothetical protein
MDIGDTVISNRGHVVIGSVVAAYFVVFRLIDAKSTQEETRAGLERSLFITLVSSGNAASFVAAIKDFGRIQTMLATDHPSWFKFWEWGRTHQPNRKPLADWAEWRLPECQKNNDYSAGDESRLDLYRAKLNGADLSADILNHADLTVTDLGHAELMRTFVRDAKLGLANLTEALLEHADVTYAKLHAANLTDAHLRAANLGLADLTAADLTDVELTAADLTAAKLDGHAQLDEACGTPAKLPEGLHPRSRARRRRFDILVNNVGVRWPNGDFSTTIFAVFSRTVFAIPVAIVAAIFSRLAKDPRLRSMKCSPIRRTVSPQRIGAIGPRKPTKLLTR